MTITVNGEKRDIQPGATIPALLEAIGLGKAACAVEVNKTLVPRKKHQETALAEGDVVEVVSLVGGG